MRTEEEIRALAERLEERRDSGLYNKTATTILHARATTLRWALGEEED
jgi:hypothetical protein